MSLTTFREDEYDKKTRAKSLLEKFKQKEKELSFYTKKIDSKTTIFCKNKERIDEIKEHIEKTL